MNTTGIIRQLDSLGRIVIPKEIRKIMNFKMGEPIEIFINQEGVVALRKYSPISSLESFAQKYTEIISELTQNDVLITDRKVIIGASGEMKKYLNLKIGPTLRQAIESDSPKITTDQEKLEIIEGAFFYTSYIIMPIMVQQYTRGLIVIARTIDDNMVSGADINIANITRQFLEKYFSDSK